MEELNRIAEYAKKTYPQRFRKVKLTRVKGKIVNREVIHLDPIVVDGGSHWRVSNHHDASPIILSKQV